ncbi:MULTISPECIES: hypothetical protein [unclassified Adlercreutzia]|uniref:hypothetical protein n=1 Tax=unclassified Adlercreutzia TaxID=2636013 RepID=UPI0013EC27F9|nr:MULTISPECIES: hypothetical protein [unclassified Adlercreutzia]
MVKKVSPPEAPFPTIATCMAATMLCCQHNGNPRDMAQTAFVTIVLSILMAPVLVTLPKTAG